jgi:hypothetical protein
VSDREHYSERPQERDPWLAQFRQFWSALINALERYLDRVEPINPNKNGNKDD